MFGNQSAISSSNMWQSIRHQLISPNKLKYEKNLLSGILHEKVRLRRNYCSSAKTDENPQGLPHLPVPPLDKTLTKYLKSVKPLLTEEEYCITQELTRKFRCNEGEVLQKFLLDRAKCTNNWLAEWWLEMAYLGFRQPLPFYSSPGHVFPFPTFKDEEQKLSYTSNLIQAAAAYKLLIENQALPMDKMGKHELDMNQYNKIFGTNRKPDRPVDELEYHSTSSYCVVAHKNHFFRMEIFDDCRKILSECQIKEALKSILSKSADCVGPPIGIFTAEHRDRWTDVYSYLMKSPINCKSISTIEQSLFLVCIDEQLEIDAPNKQTLASHQCMHGGGSQFNSGNRWFDKTIQFIVSPNGVAGISYEHSPSDGQPIAFMVDFIYKFLTNGEGAKIPNATDFDDEPIYLGFKLDEKIKEELKTACTNVDNYVADVDFYTFTFDNFGKEFIKKQKFSPDSFIQIAIQLTFYRIHNGPGAHYESAATRIYVDGRTETIRSCSEESTAFCKAMVNDCVSDKEKVELLKTAIDAHKKYTLDAIQGYGCDRHLLGLKKAAQLCEMPIPAMFEDVGYTRSVHMRLSTSQVTTKCDSVMCYGPVVEDGYGCCYNPRENSINFACAAFNSNPTTSADNFHETLKCSLLSIEKILTSSKL